MNNESLQNGLQAAVGRVTKAQRVADAVCKLVAADPAQYQHPHDLMSHPSIVYLVNGHNDLSITLSDAYRQGLVGRVHAPRGRERFAYGPPGPTADGPKLKRGVIKSAEKAVVGYRLTKTYSDPNDALQAMAINPGAEVVTSNGDYLVRFPVWSVDKLLAVLCNGRDDIAVEEVTK